MELGSLHPQVMQQYLQGNLSGVTLPSTPNEAPQGLGTILTGTGILALLAPFIGGATYGAIGGALGAKTGRRRP